MRWEYINSGSGNDGAFISVWKTDNAGSSNNDQITLPLITGETYSMTVDWGDDTTSEITSASDSDKTHTYDAAGTYTVRITGTNGGLKFNDSGDKLKILEIQQWGTLEFPTNALFKGCANLNITASDSPIVTTTNFFEMFRGCSSLLGGVGGIDISSVTSLSRCFYGCTNFNGDLSGWDTSSVSNMSDIFRQCSAFNGDISGWNTSSLSGFLSHAFLNCESFNQDLSLWDVSRITSFNATFSGCTVFNQDLSSWDVSGGTFGGGFMFYNCASFDQDLSSWNVTSWTDFRNMFFGARLSTANYDALLIAWAALDVQDSKSFHGGTSQYSSGAAATARQSLINDDLWTITDGGLNETIIVFSGVSSVTLPFLLDGVYNVNVDWGDGSSSTILTYTGTGAGAWLAANTHTYSVAGDYTVVMTGVIEGWDFADYPSSKNAITDIQNWGPLNITTNSAFYDCSNLNVSATDTPTISSTDLSYTFYGCSSLTSVGGDWGVSSVSSFQSMFQNCPLFNGDLSSWDVSSGTDFRQMFSGCSVFNGDFSSWDVSSMTLAQQMFSQCSAFNSDLSSWDVSSLKNSFAMFDRATSFNSDISNWVLTSIQYMASMFSGASSFDQPIGSWDISNLWSLPWASPDFALSGFLNGATSFDQDLSGLDISGATQLYNFISSSGMSVANYNLTLIGFASQSVNSNVTFGSPSVTPTGAGLDAKNYLITVKSWTF